MKMNIFVPITMLLFGFFLNAYAGSVLLNVVCRCNNVYGACSVQVPVKCVDSGTNEVKFDNSVSTPHQISFTTTKSGVCTTALVDGYNRSSGSYPYTASLVTADWGDWLVTYTKQDSTSCSVPPTTPTDRARCLASLPTITGGSSDPEAQILAKRNFCTGVKAMVDAEHTLGSEVFYHFTNTPPIRSLMRHLLEDMPLWYSMERFGMGRNGAAPTQYGLVDIDWYNDLMAVRDMSSNVDLMYVLMKSFWNDVRLGEKFLAWRAGRPADPEARGDISIIYEDANERRAVSLIWDGKIKYSDLWPSDWYNSNCQPCGYDVAQYKEAMVLYR